MIDPRKLAAIDLALLGPTFVIAEFALGGILSLALGVFVLYKSHSWPQHALGLYFIALGFNYVPMFAYAIAIGNRQNARTELGEVLNDRRGAMAKYRRQSLWLLAPLLVPLAALSGRRHSRKQESHRSP